MRQCFTHQAGLAERMGHCSPSSKNSCDFQHFMPFDLLFERKKNAFICSVSSHRCGTTLGTALGFCTRVAEPRNFVPVAEDGWVQESRRGCRGTGEGTRSGHAVAMHPKLASWKYPPLSLELCQRFAFAEHLSCGNHGSLLWLCAGAKEFSGRGF